MIVFDLACPHGHAFEGWFDSADAYADQRGRGLVRCPVCDDPGVEKKPSARVNTLASKASRRGGSRSRREAPAQAGQGAQGQDANDAARAQAAANAQAVANAQAAQAAAMGLPPEILAKLREVVRNTENVGDRFAQEARKIHYEEVPPRAIRGQATPDEAESLREEGIDFAPLPPDLTSETH